MPPNKKAKVKRPWQDVAKEAQELRDSTLHDVTNIVIPDVLGWDATDLIELLPTPETNSMTSMSPSALVFQISSRKLSATKVIETFLRRASMAQELVIRYP